MAASWRRQAERATICAIFLGVVGAFLPAVQTSARSQPAAVPATVRERQAVLDTYCVTCHNQRLRTAGLALDSLDVTKPGANAEVWERVIAKLRAGSMPPPGRPRPDAATYHARGELRWRPRSIARGRRSPNPGRISAVHRLNRTEYNNAIRDLFALDLDVKSLLPGDETADGSFDNFADVLSISTAHLERYLSVARQVTRLATGLPPASPALETFEIPLHVVQDDRQSEDLPFGSRGGIAIRHDFPVDGEYLIKVRLQRQYQDYLKGMGWPQQLDVRLDGKLLKRFTVGGEAPRAGPPPPATPATASQALPAIPSGKSTCRSAATPGWRSACRSRPGRTSSACRSCGSCGSRKACRNRCSAAGSSRTTRCTWTTRTSARSRSAVRTTIAGPAKDTPSRRAIFVCQPRLATEEQACATKILSRMARLAYRRPVTNADVQTLLEFFDERPAATAEASTPAFSSRSNGCSSIRTSCCASIAIRPRRQAAPGDGRRIA